MKKSISSILVAVDGSALSFLAADYAMKLAVSYGWPCVCHGLNKNHRPAGDYFNFISCSSVEVPNLGINFIYLSK
jgi:nucleotide-binding universal stress UspA family protein